jgi:hypothetical protein
MLQGGLYIAFSAKIYVLDGFREGHHTENKYSASSVFYSSSLGNKLYRKQV